MDHLMKLVTTALKWSYAQAETNVSPKHLEAAAEQLTFRRDSIQVVDAVNRVKEDKNEKQEPAAEQEKPKPKGKKAKEQEKKNGPLQRNQRTHLRNESESSPTCFLAENSDKGHSFQHLRPNFRPIYHNARRERSRRDAVGALPGACSS